MKALKVVKPGACGTVRQNNDAHSMVMKSNARRFASALSLWCVSGSCLAGTSSPIDLGGLVFLVLAFVAGWFFFAGGWRGLAVLAILVVAGMVSCEIGSHRKRSQRDAMLQARQQACESLARSEGAPWREVPDRVVVKIDASLDPMRLSNGELDLRVSTSNPFPGTTFMAEFPAKRELRTAYVHIARIDEEIPDAGKFRLHGLRTEVTDADARVVARYADYRNNGIWCSGEKPLESIERFLRTRLGKPVGIAQLPSVESPGSAVSP